MLLGSPFSLSDDNHNQYNNYEDENTDSNQQPSQLAYSFLLRLDNTGAWVVEVRFSLLCNWMTEDDDLYNK